MTGPVPGTWAVDPDAAGARPVVDGVWRLRLPTSWPGIDHVNAYLVERDDGLMLVDTGPGGHPSTFLALERAIAATGHALDDVRALVVTHAHSDHLGVARHVTDRSGAVLWMHPDDEHFHGVVRAPEAAYERRAARAVREGVPEPRLEDFAGVREEVEGGAGALRADLALEADARLPSRLGDWEVLPGRGHAPSQVLLVQRETGVAIVGDSLCVVFAAWMDYGWTHDPIAEWGLTLDAIEAIDGLRCALPGHGRPLTDLPTVLGEHRDGLAGIVERTRAAVAAGPATGYELLERVHGHTDDGIEAVGQMTELLCALRHLRLRGLVARDEAGGRHRYSTTA